MKQIFDWLREQTQEALVSNKLRIGLGMKLVVPYNCFTDLINEAEAKWESECCEWKQPKPLEFCPLNCITSCGHAEHYSVGIDKYCRHCGKHIKVLEVE